MAIVEALYFVKSGELLVYRTESVHMSFQILMVDLYLSLKIQLLFLSSQIDHITEGMELNLMFFLLCCLIEPSSAQRDIL